MNRYTDHDKNFGPITIARNKWEMFFIIISSGGDDDEETGYRNHLKIQAFNWFFRLQLPNFIRPFIVKVKAGWDEATVARLGRDWYSNSYAREYGVQIYEGDSLTLYFGVREGMGNLPKGVNQKQWHWFLPWSQWRHVRTSFYDQNGNHFWSEPDTNRMAVEQRSAVRDDYYQFKKACPKVSFWFKDYDGDIIQATTHIEEREWRSGEKWCSWLSLFRKPKIRRSLDIAFSAEVGPEKGSWKGGTTGHSIEMLSGELHEAAFRRYCKQDHERKGRKFALEFLGSQEPANCSR